MGCTWLSMRPLLFHHIAPAPPVLETYHVASFQQAQYILILVHAVLLHTSAYNRGPCQHIVQHNFVSLQTKNLHIVTYTFIYNIYYIFSYHACIVTSNRYGIQYSFMLHRTQNVRTPRRWELRTQKLKFHLLKRHNFKDLSVKHEAGQYKATHATLTARDFFLANFYPFRPFTCIFFPKLLLSFPCVSCG